MISCHQLTFRYASGPELAFADLEVEQGATLLLTGASGSGKSTWLALAAGLLPASSGRITVAGQALDQLSKINSDAWRARTIGFLPQKLHLSAALTVHDNLELAQWAAGQTTDNSRIAEALIALGVQDLSKRKPSQLSGGQAQRALFARVMLQDADVILLDEPFTAIDERTVSDLVALVRVRRHEELHEVIAGRVNKVEGIRSTQTLIAFQAYSKHDLEATFSLGDEQ